MMVFLECVGIGLGIGAVHTLVLFVVMFLARSNASNRENETIKLMRERNKLDEKKVSALWAVSNNLQEVLRKWGGK